MVLSYYLYKYPYRCLWHITRLFRKKRIVALYCAEPLDYLILDNVKSWLPDDVEIIARGKRTRAYLRLRGISFGTMPAFPDAVIMCRHAAHKFPVPAIRKFGMRHGVYHFKQFTKARNYNAFDGFFVTSRAELDLAESVGITSAIAIGFPKLDRYFRNEYTPENLNEIRVKCRIDPLKRTLLFSATWEKSGMSAIRRWSRRLDELTGEFNVLVTVHPWNPKAVITAIRQTPKITFIEEPALMPYMLLSDLMISDTSSIIGEFCVLQKPMVTFRTVKTRRSLPEIDDLLAKISVQIDRFDELPAAITRAFDQSVALAEAQRAAVRLMYDDFTDGQAGKRAAELIQQSLETGLLS
jgi:hypothetical protein